MSKNTKIQSYLDSELLRIQNNINYQEPFVQKKFEESDNIQERLNSIQKKLTMLKNMDYSQFNTASKEKIKKQSKVLFKEAPIQYASSKNKELTKCEQPKKDKDAQFTPIKHLKVSKAHSEGNFKTNPNSEVKMQPTNKKYESAKKSVKTIDKIYQQRYQQTAPRNKIYSTSKKSNNSKFQSNRLHTDTQYCKQLSKTQQKNLIDLKKSVNKCLLTQAKIQSRMGHLQNYQKGYQKLRKLFQKCQKLRKKAK